MKAQLIVRGVSYALVIASLACDQAPDGPPPAAASEPAIQPTVVPAVATAPVTQAKAALLPALDAYAKQLVEGFASIPDDRKAQLEKLALFIKARREAGEVAQVTFICTHNSRRSHLGQLLATAAATHYGVSGFDAYSGGTEVTAFNPRAVAALTRAGFAIDTLSGDNPHYQVRYSAERAAVEAFSKRYDAAPNPKTGFAAVMTCSHADVNCPIVEGAALRIPLHYEDPKAADGTDAEAETYDIRVRHIGTEMFYALSRVNG